MTSPPTRFLRLVSIATAVIVISSVIAFAAVVVFRQDAVSPYIGLRGGPAQTDRSRPPDASRGSHRRVALPPRVRL